MRQAGKLSSQQDASRLAAYLTTQGIRCRVDGAGSEWILWTYEENDLARSRQELAEFLQNPQDPRYEGARLRAQQIEREESERARKAAANVVELRSRWQRPVAQSSPITMVLIFLSIVVSLFTEFGNNASIKYFTVTAVEHDELGYQFRRGLPEIKEGEVWRLISPIFLHFGPLHLLFNMYMLFVLGGMIESRLGSVRIALLVLVAAIVGDLAQYQYNGPVFGGMSGVVYGLFGYAWMKGTFDPTFGIRLHPNTVFMMVAWFFLCWSGAIGHVANMAHGAGLGVGMLVGYLPTVLRR